MYDIPPPDTLTDSERLEAAAKVWWRRIKDAPSPEQQRVALDQTADHLHGAVLVLPRGSAAQMDADLLMRIAVQRYVDSYPSRARAAA